MTDQAEPVERDWPQPTPQVSNPPPIASDHHKTGHPLGKQHNLIQHLCTAAYLGLPCGSCGGRSAERGAKGCFLKIRTSRASQCASGTQIVTSRSHHYRGEGKLTEEEKQQDEEEVEMGVGQEAGLFLP
ncbi:unnamed protein product [Pleuronectes platessa]|uniref:Uncharacterized protein n=1 Tax=Pleuronectes platessa TaxID=8262 RepID=A0A9N7YZY9_PLEPL|nr:unnamed protein product [Pleuronectes platessa]